MPTSIDLYNGVLSGTSMINQSTLFFNTGGLGGNYHRILQDTCSTLTIYDQDNIGVFLSNNNVSWSTNSDIRIKKNIFGFQNVLPQILKLKPSHFNYINDPPEYPLRGGFIAQEIELVFPEIVSIGSYDETIKDNIKGISTTELIPYIVQAIKDQNEIVASQQTQITELQTALSSQQSQIDSLTQQLAYLTKP